MQRMGDVEIQTPMAKANGTPKKDKESECIKSETVTVSMAQPPELTPKQVELIKGTWQYVQPNMQEAGLILFEKLFSIAPDLLKLFSFKNEELNRENEGLRKHGLQVMESIDAAVGLLEDPKELQEVLITLGIVHHMNEVQLESFGPVGEALVFTLETGLKEKFTDEVKTAWVTLYTIVQHFMTIGMKEGLDA